MRGFFHTAGCRGNICYDGSRVAIDGNARELGCDFGLRFFKKVFDAAAADVGTEELGCEIGDLVCLVEDHGVRGTEDVTEAVLLQGQIRQEQVVIDYDYVRIQCVTAGDSDVAA